MKRKAIIFAAILATALVSGHRIRKIQSEGERHVHNIVRIQAERGAPHDHIIAKKTTDVLLEPLFVEKGRALVSVSRVNRFAVGDRIRGVDARIVSVSGGVDLDTGMFVVRLSKNITGEVWVEKLHTGFFLPIDSVLPAGAKMIAKDNERMVAAGLKDGDKVIVK